MAENGAKDVSAPESGDRRSRPCERGLAQGAQRERQDVPLSVAAGRDAASEKSPGVHFIPRKGTPRTLSFNKHFLSVSWLRKRCSVTQRT